MEDRRFTQLQAPIRGARDYIHGTDVFTNLVGCLSSISITEIGNLELKFSSSVRHCFDVDLAAEKSDLFMQSPVQMTFDLEDIRHYMCIVSSQDEPTKGDTTREDSIASLITCDNERFSIQNQGDYSTIEKIVFINKYMLLARVENTARWFFGRLRMDSYRVDESARVELAINAITGTGLASSDIYINSQMAGDIVFLPQK